MKWQKERRMRSVNQNFKNGSAWRSMTWILEAAWGEMQDRRLKN
jgi:hypothetical protein